MTKRSVKDLQRRVDVVGARTKPANPGVQSWTPVMKQLTADERMDLARAFRRLEESHGTASLKSFPPAQKAAFLKAQELYEKQKTSERR